MKLIDENNKKIYDEAHKTREHLYPNENIVRLEKWFFNGKTLVSKENLSGIPFKETFPKS